MNLEKHLLSATIARFFSSPKVAKSLTILMREKRGVLIKRKKMGVVIKRKKMGVFIKRTNPRT